MDQALVFDQTITAENDPIIITGLTSPVVMVHLLLKTLKAYPESPQLAVEQILPNSGNPFIADRQLVEMKAEPLLVRLRANYPYSLRIDYPGWISSGILKVWEVTGFDFFSSGGSSTPIDLTGYVQATDPRLTDARSPLPHSQGIDTIDGLQAALDDKVTIGSSGTTLKYALLQDQKTAGSHGGIVTAGAWNVLPLQTIVYDPGGIVSLSGNQFTLGAGTYWIQALGSLWSDNGVQQSGRCRIFNVTDAVVSLLGLNARQHHPSGASAQSFNPVNGLITIASLKTFRLEQRVQSSYGNEWASGLSDGFTIEIYREVQICKIA